MTDSLRRPPADRVTTTPARGPRALPLLGVIPELSRDPLAFLMRAALDHGPVARFNVAHTRDPLASTHCALPALGRSGREPLNE